MAVERIVGIAGVLFERKLRRPLTQDLEPDDMGSHALKWLPAVILAVYATVVEDEELSSLGVRWDGPEPLLKRVAVGLAVLLGANVVLEPLHERLGIDDLEAGIAAYEETSIPERLFVALTAGVTEEVLYRGYLLERLETETDSRLLAAVGSTLAFVLAHKGDQWDWGSLPLIAQPAALLTLFYLRTRDLLAAIAIHALDDVVGLLALERVLDDE